MRYVPVLLSVTFLLLLACGCSESPAAPGTTVQTTVTTVHVPTATELPQTTALMPSRTASVSDNTILIAKNTFTPADMTVPVGSTVRWVNADDHPHRIEFEDKAFTASTFLLGASQSASQRFDRTGSYNYSCMIHPYMKGVITVGA